MSEQDKRRVKSAVLDFIRDRQSCTAGEAGAHAEAETGLAFGLTTIGRFLADLGWERQPRPRPHGGSHYVRPEGWTPPELGGDKGQ